MVALINTADAVVVETLCHRNWRSVGDKVLSAVFSCKFICQECLTIVIMIKKVD